jgi:hypothetical protein
MRLFRNRFGSRLAIRERGVPFGFAAVSIEIANRNRAWNEGSFALGWIVYRHARRTLSRRDERHRPDGGIPALFGGRSERSERRASR